MKFKPKILIAILVIIAILCLTGCSLKKTGKWEWTISPLSKEDQKYADELVAKYSEKFRQQAKTQYGKNAKVENINAQTESDGEFSVYPTNNLVGEISANNETFSALYSIEENKIFPHYRKNIEKINDSIPEYFYNVLGIDVCYGYVSFTIVKRADNYIPDEVDTYEELKEQNNIGVKLYTTSDIDKLDEEFFRNVKDKIKANIRIIQIEDATKAKAICESEEMRGIYYIPSSVTEEKRKGLQKLGVICIIENLGRTSSKPYGKIEI